jgi:hypothetical protein
MFANIENGKARLNRGWQAEQEPLDLIDVINKSTQPFFLWRVSGEYHKEQLIRRLRNKRKNYYSLNLE